MLATALLDEASGIDDTTSALLTPWIYQLQKNLSLLYAVLPFSKLNKIFVGYFDPENIFLANKIINFRGDLTDNSAKKEALAVWPTAS